MSGTLFMILAAIVLVAGFAGRRRVRRAREGHSPVTGDDLLRSILDDDELRALEDDPLEDEPLDEDEIRRAEDEFWEGSWDDDPEGWRD